jgi:hypothetical protein
LNPRGELPGAGETSSPNAGGVAGPDGIFPSGEIPDEPAGVERPDDNDGESLGDDIAISDDAIIEDPALEGAPSAEPAPGNAPPSPPTPTTAAPGAVPAAPTPTNGSADPSQPDAGVPDAGIAVDDAAPPEGDLQRDSGVFDAEAPDDASNVDR